MKNFKKLASVSVAQNYLVLSFLIMLSSAFSFTTYIPFLLSRAMNLWQINLINSFFMATIILMELPTGSFADKFGRHRSITLSCFLMALGLMVYFFSDNFWLFIAAEVVIGLGKTFASGALEAWMVDSLKTQGLIGLKEKLFRQESYFSSAGAILGSLAGAYAGNSNLAWPWLMGAVLSLLVALYSLVLKEPYYDKNEKRVRVGLGQQIKIACEHGFSNKDLISFMVLGAILALAVQALNMQWTIVFQKQYSLETKYLGWIFTGIALTQAWGGHLSKYSQRLFKDEKKSLAFTQIVTGVVIIVLTQLSGLTSTLSFFFLHELSRGAFKPLKQSFFNNHLLTETRATVLSLDSMINKVGSFIGLLASGFIANAYSIKIAWLVSGLFLLACALFFFLPRKTIAPAEIELEKI
jgi:MFS family permease